MSVGDYVLAIVGSRTLKDRAIFLEGIVQVLETWGMPGRVVSGGAAGADIMGEIWANDNNIPTTILRPDWRKYGKGAGLRRNHDIIRAADRVLAFPSPSGSGTQHSIGLARRGNKKLCIVALPQ